MFDFSLHSLDYTSKSFSKHFHRGVSEESYSKHFHRGVSKENALEIANTVVFQTTNTFYSLSQQKTTHSCPIFPLLVILLAIHCLKILYTP